MEKLKNLIDTDMLEQVYKNRLSEDNAKIYIPVDVMEKAMLLEVYKMLSVIFEERGGD